MAEIFVRHCLSDKKAVKFNFAITRSILKHPTSEGDEVWLLQIGSETKDKNGKALDPVYIHEFSRSDSTIEDEIEGKVAELCSQLDWGELQTDTYKPLIKEFFPVGNSVSTKDFVRMKLVDELPGSGMDISDIKVIFNNGDFDFDITSEAKIVGDPFEYEVVWRPAYLY